MMNLLMLLAFLMVCGATTSMALAETAAPRIRFTTTQGDIVIELNAKAAPKTVENVLGYAREGFYDGTIFHRVILDFMIQGGGLTIDMQQKKSSKPPVMNEADNGLKNARGTVAMARTNDPHSATSQFFINTVENVYLDHKSKTPQGWGYCVFGKVVEGMDVVDAIQSVKTTNRAGHQDVPAEPIIIKRAVVEQE